MSVSFSRQPQDVINADSGSTVTFSVSVGIVAGGSVRYQWKRHFSTNDAALVEGSHFSGTRASVLTIANISSVDAATYFCQVTQVSNNVTIGSTNSDYAKLTIKGLLTVPLDGVGSGGVVVGGGSSGGGITLSGQGPSSGLNLQSYTQKQGSSALSAFIHPKLINKLTPQDGHQLTRGEYGEDILSVPFKIPRTSGWLALLPKKGQSLADIGTMWCWDPLRTVSTKGPMGLVTCIFKGLLDGTLPDAIVYNDTTIQSVSVQTADGASLEMSFYAPRTVYRYITRQDPQGLQKYNSVLNSTNRPIRVYRSLISTNLISSDDDRGTNFYQPLYAVISEVCVSHKDAQCGGIWLCEDECLKTLVNPYSA